MKCAMIYVVLLTVPSKSVEELGNICQMELKILEEDGSHETEEPGEFRLDMERLGRTKTRYQEDQRSESLRTQSIQDEERGD